MPRKNLSLTNDVIQAPLVMFGVVFIKSRIRGTAGRRLLLLDIAFVYGQGFGKGINITDLSSVASRI